MNYAKAYTALHAHKGGKYFPGYSISPYVDDIAALVHEHKPERLLDYGCGKGFQYLARRVHMKWGGLLPHCYDPGVPPLARKPEGLFEGIICTDVMEHIEEDDVDEVLADLFACAAPQSFVFMVIACRPSKKTLPDGRSVHLTVKPPEWWEQKLEPHRRDGMVLRVEYDEG